MRQWRSCCLGLVGVPTWERGLGGGRKLASGTGTHDKDWTRGMLHDPFGNAAHPEVPEARSSVSGHHYEVDRGILGLLNDSMPRHPGFDGSIEGHAGWNGVREGLHLLVGGLDQALRVNARHTGRVASQIKISRRHQHQFDNME